MKGKRGMIAAAAVLVVVSVLMVWGFSNRKPEGESGRTSSKAEQIEAYLAKLGVQRYIGMVEAADFELPDLGGKQVRLSTFRGTLVFLNFWATWCPACRAEMPSMEKLYKAFKDKGLVMLAVSSDAGGAKVVGPFMQDYRLTFPALLDPDGRVTRMYQVRGIPTTYLIDREGRVIGRAVGARDWATPEAQRLIELLLAM